MTIEKKSKLSNYYNLLKIICLSSIIFGISGLFLFNSSLVISIGFIIAAISLVSLAALFLYETMPIIKDLVKNGISEDEIKSTNKIAKFIEKINYFCRACIYEFINNRIQESFNSRIEEGYQILEEILKEVNIKKDNKSKSYIEFIKDEIIEKTLQELNVNDTGDFSKIFKEKLNSINSILRKNNIPILSLDLMINEVKDLIINKMQKTEFIDTEAYNKLDENKKSAYDASQKDQIIKKTLIARMADFKQGGMSNEEVNYLKEDLIIAIKDMTNEINISNIIKNHINYFSNTILNAKVIYKGNQELKVQSILSNIYEELNKLNTSNNLKHENSNLNINNIEIGEKNNIKKII